MKTNKILKSIKSSYPIESAILTVAGWEVKTLGDLFEITSSKRVFEADWKKTGIPFYRAREIVKLAKQGFVDNELFISTEMYNQYSKKYGIPQEGDIMVTGVGTLGICYVVQRDDKFYFKDGNIIWLKNTSGVDSRFVEYAFKSDILRKQIDNSIGATVGTFTIIKAKNTLIPIPPLPEQKRIVAILDEAFAAIAKAKENAEKNLRNAKELFESYLRSVFTQPKTPTIENNPHPSAMKNATMPSTESLPTSIGRTKKTGGRAPTDRHIPGELSLCVGRPETMAKDGWRWVELAQLARMESGHTPSRRHPEYWGGDVPWLGITDARAYHGRTIFKTAEYTNEQGINNSSARILPKGTVCLSRTASVGYVVVMGCPMATSQDFVNWVCTANIQPEFLKYLLLAEARVGFRLFSSGAVHQTIYFPEAKAFHICYPDVAEQKRIIHNCDALRSECEKLEAIYQQKLADLEELKKSILQKAFRGEL